MKKLNPGAQTSLDVPERITATTPAFPTHYQPEYQAFLRGQGRGDFRWGRREGVQLSPFFASIFPLFPQKRLILRLTHYTTGKIKTVKCHPSLCPTPQRVARRLSRIALRPKFFRCCIVCLFVVVFFEEIIACISKNISSVKHVEITQLLINDFIIHSKYFPDSDWLKAHA